MLIFGISGIIGLQNPSGIAIDCAGGYIYWVDAGDKATAVGKVQRAALPGLSIPSSIVVTNMVTGNFYFYAYGYRVY